jgi:RimJ/RimL family protein N-acetyltransferase
LFGATRRGEGHGRRLITAALALAEAGAFVFAQVAPGNAASMRAFLGAGFAPLGAETLYEPQRD